MSEVCENLIDFLDESRTCYNKFPFSSLKSAEKVAKLVEKRNKKYEPKGIRVPMGAYWCPFCEKYHIGHCISYKVLKQIKQVKKIKQGSNIT
jgi:hypothetical protein